VGRVVEGVRVVDEEGNVEVFSAEKLAASLYGSGVPQSLIPAILDSLGASLRGRSVVSKRALVAMVSALLEDLEPDAGAGVRFASYVYALDRVYVRVGAGLSKPRWSFLRRLSREVLGERGLTPPPRLVELHAELLAREVRELVSSAPWGFEGRVLELEEVKRLAELAAPKVSVAWLELRSASAGELASEYWSRGVSGVKGGCGELRLRRAQGAGAEGGAPPLLRAASARWHPAFELREGQPGRAAEQALQAARGRQDRRIAALHPVGRRRPKPGDRGSAREQEARQGAGGARRGRRSG
jgi:hypothetical protein